MAQQPKKRKRKVKRKVKLKKSVAIVRKDSVQNDTLRRDTLPRMQGRPPADVAPTFRIKIRKKR
jgi:hypothetical protein